MSRPARPSSRPPGTGRPGPRPGRPARTATATLAGAAVAACAARGAYALLRRHPPGGEKTWVRTNHRGELLTLLEGPALPLGAVAGGAVTALVAGQSGPGRGGAVRRGLPPALAGLGALGFGVLDDLRGSGQRRGLRGHLGALAHGEVTTGAVKLAGLAAAGLGSALLDGGEPADIAVNAGLIAGGANLLNLFDLRPGRAGKVALVSAALVAAAGAGRSGGRLAGLAAVAAPAAATAALLPEDLAERAMLGDAGANALGALLGAAAARSLPRRARVAAFGGIVALTGASEKISFTKVIAATPPLHWLDMLGRRPAPLAAPVAGAYSGAGPAEDQPRRRRPGRHRRVANGVSRFRSVGWISGLLDGAAPVPLPAPTDPPAPPGT